MKKLKSDGKDFESWILNWGMYVAANQGWGEILNNPLPVPEVLPNDNDEKFFFGAPEDEAEEAGEARRLRALILAKMMRRIDLPSNNHCCFARSVPRC